MRIEFNGMDSTEDDCRRLGGMVLSAADEMGLPKRPPAGSTEAITV